MIFFGTIIGLILMCISVVLTVEKEINPTPTSFAFAGFLIILVCNAIVDTNSPSAIDVYRGKTTLEITYRDGIAMDSVVVFKDKEN